MSTPLSDQGIPVHPTSSHSATEHITLSPLDQATTQLTRGILRQSQDYALLSPEHRTYSYLNSGDTSSLSSNEVLSTDSGYHPGRTSLQPDVPPTRTHSSSLSRLCQRVASTVQRWQQQLLPHVSGGWVRFRSLSPRQSHVQSTEPVYAEIDEVLISSITKQSTSSPPPLPPKPPHLQPIYCELDNTPNSEIADEDLPLPPRPSQSSHIYSEGPLPFVQRSSSPIADEDLPLPPRPTQTRAAGNNQPHYETADEDLPLPPRPTQTQAAGNNQSHYETADEDLPLPPRPSQSSHIYSEGPLPFVQRSSPPIYEELPEDTAPRVYETPQPLAPEETPPPPPPRSSKSKTP